MHWYDTICGRCKRVIRQDHAEICWYCLEDLCYDCWDEYGHCGHPEADKINEIASQVKQPDEN